MFAFFKNLFCARDDAVELESASAALLRTIDTESVFNIEPLHIEPLHIEPLHIEPLLDQSFLSKWLHRSLGCDSNGLPLLDECHNPYGLPRDIWIEILGFLQHPYLNYYGHAPKKFDFLFPATRRWFKDGHDVKNTYRLMTTARILVTLSLNNRFFRDLLRHELDARKNEYLNVWTLKQYPVMDDTHNPRALPSAMWLHILSFLAKAFENNFGHECKRRLVRDDSPSVFLFAVNEDQLMIKSNQYNTNGSAIVNGDTRTLFVLSCSNRFFRDLLWHELRSRKAQYRQIINRQWGGYAFPPIRERLLLPDVAVNLRADNFMR